MTPTDLREEFDRAETKARSFGQNIESDLAPKFLRVVENAAIASARTMGRGERELSDKVAVEAMRHTMDTIPMHARIVIGEGERDQAPMLYIGERVGAEFPDGMVVPEVDIAVDPLEGTNLCANCSRTIVQRPCGSGCTRCRKPEKHCQGNGTKCSGPGNRGARPSSA